MIDYRMTDDGIMEMHIAGQITKDDIDAAWRQIEADLKADQDIRILEVIGDIEGIEPSALWKDVKLGLPMSDRVKKAAIVSDRRWVDAVTEAAKLFTSGEVKTFEPGEVDTARSWLKAA